MLQDGEAQMVADRIFTIGYSGFLIEDFVQILRQHGISAVIDVRSNPHSGYYTDYDAERLKPKLKASGIGYRNYACEFGARQTDSAYFTSEGYLDFNLFAQSARFLEGVRKVGRGVEEGFTPALMCAEKKPAGCHRAILVSRWFHEHGYQVTHILPKGATESQEDVVCQLKDQFFPNRAQISFDSINLSDEDYARKAYDKANEKIGYRDAVEKPAGDPYQNYAEAI
jgi:uncharacterized protein (DUF488 family)